MRTALRLLFVFSMLGVSGCYQMNLNNGAAGGAPVERRQHLFALGFYGDPDIDLQRECPSGVANVATRFTAEDVLLTIASVGIYAPRTVVVECGRNTRG